MTRAVISVGVAVACAASTVPAYAADDAVRIWTDATGPLFSSANLEPGATRTQCLALGYEGRDGTSLRMAAATSGRLGSYLDLTVAVGTGGVYGSCAGFVGAEVYFGTLADFSSRYADPSAGLALDSGAAGPGVVSLRITLRLQDDNRAQGETAESSFVWYALGNGDDPAEPPEVEVPVTGSGPTAAPPAPTTPSAATTPTASPPPVSTATPRPTSPAPTASPTRTRTPEPVAGGPAAGPGEDDRRSLLERMFDTVYDTVREAAPAVVQGARIPLYLLPLVLLFLLIQNEIDRRDPKLALAPAYADPDLPFDYDPTPAKA